MTIFKAAVDSSLSLKISALDTVRNVHVAIKKLTHPFRNARLAKRTYRELSLLKHINHENVIGLLDVFTSSSTLNEFQDVYIVTPLCGQDLSHIIRNSQLSNEIIRFLIYQILCGLKYIHSAGIIHRDLKPSNITVTEDCELKILDFGLSRYADEKMTDYVTTRWYRAPEIMLNQGQYDKKVDIWSLGCIMAELLTSKPLFRGTSPVNQFNLIVQLCGKPDEDYMQKIFSFHAKRYIRTLPDAPKQDFKEVFRGADPEAIDLLERMLEIDPDKRPTAVEALAHPYLALYADPSNELTADEPIDASFEDEKLSVEEWKRKIFEEIKHQNESLKKRAAEGTEDLEIKKTKIQEEAE